MIRNIQTSFNVHKSLILCIITIFGIYKKVIDGTKHFSGIIFKTMITNKENITILCLHWRSTFFEFKFKHTLTFISL
jgi:hypothetical protein